MGLTFLSIIFEFLNLFFNFLLKKPHKVGLIWAGVLAKLRKTNIPLLLSLILD